MADLHRSQVRRVIKYLYMADILVSWRASLSDRPMYIGSREGEHTEFGEELQEHLETLLYVSHQ